MWIVRATYLRAYRILSGVRYDFQLAAALFHFTKYQEGLRGIALEVSIVHKYVLSAGTKSVIELQWINRVKKDMMYASHVSWPLLYCGMAVVSMQLQRKTHLDSLRSENCRDTQEAGLDHQDTVEPFVARPLIQSVPLLSYSEIAQKLGQPEHYIRGTAIKAWIQYFDTKITRRRPGKLDKYHVETVRFHVSESTPSAAHGSSGKSFWRPTTPKATIPKRSGTSTRREPTTFATNLQIRFNRRDTRCKSQERSFRLQKYASKDPRKAYEVDTCHNA